MNKYILISLLLLLYTASNAQLNFQAGTLPQFNLSVKLNDKWKLSNKLEARQIFQEGDFTVPPSTRFVYERTDLGTVLTRKIGDKTALGAGYLIRLKGNEFMHRFSQQFCLKSKDKPVNFAHRFLFDQSIEKGEAVTFRLRYRISTELPLTAAKVEPKSLYLKLSNEYLGIADITELTAEMRAGLMLGYMFCSKSKIEFGLDYRLKDFVEAEATHQFWLYLGVSVSI
jgi:hypothetical protein